MRNKQVVGSLVIGVFIAVFLAGCAEITPPNPIDVIKNPMGKDVRIGETKDEIIAKWGEPDRITPMGFSNLGAEKEEWVYIGRYPSVPLDYKYVSKTKYLYFEGNVLTSYRAE